MKRFDQINMIPFIDIMLVLLTMVLTTATFISQGVLEINLPVSKSATSFQASNTKTVEIAINKNRQLLFNGEKIEQPLLASNLKDLDKQTTILLRVDSNVVFVKFVDIIDLLKTYKLDNLKIITKYNQ